MARVPAYLTPFVGRERELSDLLERLEETRLLTLTGAGGCGKTRLAVELARRWGVRHPDDVAWVELAALTDPRILARHVAGRLGLRLDPRGSVEDAVVDALGAASRLLVLDSCEHLVDACAELAGTLLGACPELRLLVTTREALDLSGEFVQVVHPLSLPPEDGVTVDVALESEAVQLFVRRAGEVRESFRLREEDVGDVARICRRLDGIPLAVELAAARMRVLGPAQIAERLDDAFRVLGTGPRTALPRHRTLRAAVDWSYEVLSVSERTLLERLSVFSGGFALEAVEEVCTDGGPDAAVGAAEHLPRERILDVLSMLVHRSLVTVVPVGPEVRYRLLEPVRQYAAERLGIAGGREPLRARHGAYFLALAERAEPHVFGGASEPRWVDLLEREEANLRAAADWAEEDGSRAEVALRLAAALHWFWFARGRSFTRVGAGWRRRWRWSVPPTRRTGRRRSSPGRRSPSGPASSGLRSMRSTRRSRCFAMRKTDGPSPPRWR